MAANASFAYESIGCDHWGNAKHAFVVPGWRECADVASALTKIFQMEYPIHCGEYCTEEYMARHPDTTCNLESWNCRWNAPLFNKVVQFTADGTESDPYQCHQRGTTSVHCFGRAYAIDCPLPCAAIAKGLDTILEEYEAVSRCNGAGTFQVNNGTCKCNVGVLGSSCDHCIEGLSGKLCQYSDIETCTGKGAAQFDGTCLCDDPAVGIGPTCSEHDNEKTCSNLGVAQTDGSCICSEQPLRDANNGCVCLGPETGVGPECEFSNAKTCTDHGVAQPGGTCLCSTGYTGASCAGECATETHTRWDEPSAGGGFECHANFRESCDRGFYFNADTSDPTSRTCTICPVNTYADGILEDGQYDGGKRIACKSCPDEFQVSPAGSVSVDQCKYKWKILDTSSDTMQATLAAGFCTGLDAESTLHFTTMANGPADCREFADTKQLTFSSGLPACEDLAANEDCELVCGAARAGKSIDVTTNAGGKESAAEACKVTCGLCDSGTTAGLATPSGCVLEHGSDSSDPKTGIVRYYADEERKRYLGINYTPICESFVCTVALQEVITESTMDSPPVCAFGSKYTDAKQDEEGNVYILFYYITFGSIAFIVCLAYSGSKYCCCRAGCDDWEWPSCSTHRFIWVGLVFRLADLATDWAFWVINVNGELFETKVNPDLSDRTSSGGMFDSSTANFDIDAFKLAALLVCIVGSVLTPIDIMSKMPACQTRREGAGMNFSCCTLGRKSAIIIALLVILVEDIPQILITVTYIIQLNEPFFDLSSDWTSTALTVGNIVVSSGSLLYNLYIVVKGCCTWKSDAEMEESLERKLAKLQATTHNEAFTGY